jgi:hypothetical protein
MHSATISGTKQRRTILRHIVCSAEKFISELAVSVILEFLPIVAL